MAKRTKDKVEISAEIGKGGKKSYSQPRLSVYGSFQRITLGGTKKGGTKTDTDSGQGTSRA